MASLAQIEANRRNSQKSTGPRTLPGKTASSMNALKTGIHAETLVIRHEDAAALEDLALEYHRRFQPADPEEASLVAMLVHADWSLRRFRRIENELWAKQFAELDSWDGDDPERETPVADCYRGIDVTLARLQQRVNSAERSFHRALAQLHRLRKLRPDPPEPETIEPAPPPQIGFVPSDFTPSPDRSPVAWRSVGIRPEPVATNPAAAPAGS